MTSAMDKILDADPILERNMTICQGKGKMFTQYHKLYDEMMQISTIQTVINKVFKRNKTF